LIVLRAGTRFLSEKRLRAWGTALGRLAFRVSRKYRERCLANLKMCFPEWDENRIRHTALQVFEHFGKTTLSFLAGDRLTPEQILNSISAHGLPLLDEALQKGKGVILLTPHFGNWERMAHFLTLKGYPLLVVAREANDPRTTHLVNSMRQKEGLVVLPRGSSIREILRALTENKIIGLLPDQNSWEIFVPFFGYPAGTVSGPAVLHLRTGAPLLVCFCWEDSESHYQLRIRNLALPERTGNREEDVRAIMTKVNEAFEEVIREHPEQWLWLHDRWRSARLKGFLREQS
jgi:KDO2-lipid IV(A) lauroyltransferase